MNGAVGGHRPGGQEARDRPVDSGALLCGGRVQAHLPAHGLLAVAQAPVAQGELRRHPALHALVHQKRASSIRHATVAVHSPSKRSRTAAALAALS